MAHAYVTYFDKNYAVKGIAMIQSLIRHDPGSEIRVVCLDDETFSLLAAIGISGLVPVRLRSIEAGDAALAEARANRSRVEYYWTLTPTIMLRFLQQMKGNEVLTYVDGDLLFFSGLEAVFQELGERSVLIHGHNFPPRYASFAVNGLYNVGLVSVRNNQEGLNVVSWWRERCNEWCYARCEGGKMGDQKYLEDFPRLTDSIAIAASPGIGVGPWNYMGYRLSAVDGIPRVNGFPTVFYHYHSAAYLSPGALAPCTDLSYPVSRAMLDLYAVPYLEALDRAFADVHRAQPDFRAGFKTDPLDERACVVARPELEDSLREDCPCVVRLQNGFVASATPQFPDGAKECGPVIRAGDLYWVGDFPDWAAAARAAGSYDDRAIFEKTRAAAAAVRDGEALWERDSVLFQNEEWNWPLLASLFEVAALNDGKLQVLDFGGAFGSTYMQHRRPLGRLKECVWHIVEQAHFVEAGQNGFATPSLRFHQVIEDALTAAPINVILLSSVLQYLPDAYRMLNRLLKTGLPIIIERTPMLPDADRITVQHVPPSIYKASYPCRWLSRKRVESLLRSAGYTLSPWRQSAVDPQGFVGVTAMPRRERERERERGRKHQIEVSGRLRVMQVDDFYPAYLNHFYAQRPGLGSQGSHEQTKALFDDAFSAVHAVVPYLDKSRFDTSWFVSRALPLQRAWALENDLPFPCDARNWQFEMVRQRIEYFRPDVLYIANPVAYGADFLASLSWRPRLVMGWRAADMPCDIDLHGYDVILSGLPGLLDFAVSRGAGKGLMFKPGMPRWLADKVAGTPKTVDVCFVGSISPRQHAKRIAMLEFLAQSAIKNGFSLALNLNRAPDLLSPLTRKFLKPPVFGLHMHKSLAAAKIVVDSRGEIGVIRPNGDRIIDLAADETINMRIFEVTGSGSLLLTSNLAGLSKYFNLKNEIDVWDNLLELEDKILYWLGHEEHLQKVSMGGLTRCLADHGMDKAAIRFSEIIMQNIDTHSR